MLECQPWGAQLLLCWVPLILFLKVSFAELCELGSREDNNAERIFKIMPERNAHSYCTMIRGMVKVKLCCRAARCSVAPEVSHA